jgi:hypothetical protein
MERYSTWQEAEQGHEVVCAQVRRWLARDRQDEPPSHEEETTP